MVAKGWCEGGAGVVCRCGGAGVGAGWGGEDEDEVQSRPRRMYVHNACTNTVTTTRTLARVHRKCRQAHVIRARARALCVCSN